MNDLEEQLRQLPQAKPSERLDNRMQDLFERAEQQARPRGIPWWVFVPACIACLLAGMYLTPADVPVPQNEVKNPAPPSIEAPETVLVELRMQHTHPLFTSSRSDQRPWYEQPARMIEQE